MASIGYLNRFYLFLIDKIQIGVFASHHIMRKNIEFSSMTDKESVGPETKVVQTMRMTPISLIHLNKEK